MEPRLRPMGVDELLDGGARRERRVPSLRRVLVEAGLVAVVASVWAVTKDTWEPLVLLIPYVLSLPPQVRRWWSASQFGNALWSGLLGGLAFGLLGWVLGIRGLYIFTGVFAVGYGLLSGFMWGRRRPRKRGSWLGSTPSSEG